MPTCACRPAWSACWCASSSRRACTASITPRAWKKRTATTPAWSRSGTCCTARCASTCRRIAWSSACRRTTIRRPSRSGRFCSFRSDRSGTIGKSPKQKQETDGHLEETQRNIEPPEIHGLAETRVDGEGQRADHGPRRPDHAKCGQWARDVARLEPQPGAGRRGETIEQQAGVVLIEAHAEVEASQNL